MRSLATPCIRSVATSTYRRPQFGAGAVAGARLKETIEQVAATSDRITRQIGESRDTFRAQSGELAGSADATVDKIKTLMDTVRQKTTEMAATGDMLEGRAHKLSTLFVQKTKAILAAAEEAESRAAQLEGQKLDVETDMFLKMRCR